MNKKIIISIIILLLLAGIAIFWIVQREEETQQEQQVEKRQMVAEKEKQQPNQNQEQKVYYEIPELGIRFLIDQEMKDELIYYYKGESKITNSGGAFAGTAKSVGLTTRTLLDIDEGCSAEESAQGSISRYEGNAENYDVLKKRPRLSRKFDNFSILYSGSQAVCFSKENAENETYIQILSESQRKYPPFFRSQEFLQSIEIIN